MSLSFKDSAGHEWNLKIHLGIVNRLRAEKVIDLLKVTENKMARFKQLMSDPADLVGVVWEILKPQAEASGITFDAFCAALDGDAIDAMMETFSRSLADFIPALRSLILKGMEKGKETKRLATQRAIEAVDKIDPAKLVEADLKQAEAEIAAMLAGPGTESPGSAAQG